MKRFFYTLLLSCFVIPVIAQTLTHQTFKDTRVINSPSVETLGKKKLDIRIGHRFGDMFGSFGGWPTFYGLENSTDIVTGAEFGINDQLTVGINRAKGAGPLKQLINPSLKYRILHQNDAGMPFSLTAYALGSITTMSKSNNPESLSNFKNFSHRVSYNFQIIAGRKFSERFSLQISPGVVHRNQVRFGESNDFVYLSAATRIQITRVMGLILDATFPFTDTTQATAEDYFMPIGIGFEFDTGGHVFQVNLTNARGMMETDYIPYSGSNWGDGGFRLGFTISRLFNL